jgi:hypothetical protein
MSSVDDKFIRDFAFDPEFLLERTDSLKIQKKNILKKSKSINRKRNRSFFSRIHRNNVAGSCGSTFEEIELTDNLDCDNPKKDENSSSLDDLYECEDKQTDLGNNIEEFYYVSQKLEKKEFFFCLFNFCKYTCVFL